MVSMESRPSNFTAALSVLALSSRFDGPACSTGTAYCQTLSVLALSSRFDGPNVHYDDQGQLAFQYSLCRVVLMVLTPHTVEVYWHHLSVLALSSRFDGRGV